MGNFQRVISRKSIYQIFKGSYLESRFMKDDNSFRFEFLDKSRCELMYNMPSFRKSRIRVVMNIKGTFGVFQTSILSELRLLMKVDMFRGIM